MMMKHVLIAAFTVALLSGCTTLKKVTGQQNDSVLPGARENILPPDQQTARDPIVTGQPQMPQQGMAAKPMAPQGTAPQGTAPLKMPAQNAGDPPCDPNVDLCPEALPPDPLPPPSVAAPVPVKQAMAKKPVAGKADAKPLGVKKPVIIKKKKKKVVVAKPAVPADATAPAVPAVPAVPAPPPPTPPAQ